MNNPRGRTEGPEPAETRFGSPWEPLDAALALLRATASRHGAKLAPVSGEDALAAVIAADAWMLLTDRRAFAADGLTPGAVRAASTLLARAAGAAAPPLLPPAPAAEQPRPLLLRAAEEHLSRARMLGEVRAESVLLRAASDLAAGAGMCRTGDELSGYAALLAALP